MKRGSLQRSWGCWSNNNNVIIMWFNYIIAIAFLFFWQTGVFKLFEYLIILPSECSFLFYTHQVIIKSFLKKKIYYNEESHESDPNMLERNFKLRSIGYHETLKTTFPIHWGLIALLISFVRSFSKKKKKSFVRNSLTQLL